MPKYSRPLIGVVVAFIMLLGPDRLHGEQGVSRYGFRYTVALIQGGQGQNRGILEMAGTVSVNAGSAITLQLKKAHVTKLLAGEELFRPTDDRELMFRKDGERHWVLENNGADAREFAHLLSLIISLLSVQATGKPPETLLGVVGKDVVEQKRTGWVGAGALLVLRDSPHNGLLLKPSNKVLQGIQIGSNGQFDQLEDQFAGRTVDLPLLEGLITKSKTDHLQISVVTLIKE
jgi:hypothetical protein